MNLNLNVGFGLFNNNKVSYLIPKLLKYWLSCPVYYDWNDSFSDIAISCPWFLRFSRYCLSWFWFPSFQTKTRRNIMQCIHLIGYRINFLRISETKFRITIIILSYISIAMKYSGQSARQSVILLCTINWITVSCRSCHKY